MQKSFNEGHERNVVNSALKICSVLGDGEQLAHNLETLKIL